VVTVTATPNPSVSEAHLPSCWSLVNGTGSGKLVRTVSKTTPALTTIYCGCGTSLKTTKIYVVNLRIISPGAEPPSRNFVFNGDRPGVCSVYSAGTTGISELDSGLVWTLSEVAGSLQTCIPENQTGPEVEFFYTGLPPWNTSFGPKTLTMTHPLLPQEMNSASRTIEVYYSFGAKNWPGAGPEPHPNPPPQYPTPPPNWIFTRTNYFYYYSQTDAYIQGCIYHHNGSSCSATDIPLYRAFVGSIGNPHHVAPYTYLGYSIVNSDDELFGIDCFAYACRHEWKHHMDYNTWWGPSGVNQALDNDQGIGDNIPDAIEPGYPPSQGGPYSSGTCRTRSDYTGGNDDQTECVFTQDYWGPGSGDGLDQHGNNNPSEQCLDWAYPGSRWK
jgi:hypothetical protein